MRSISYTGACAIVFVTALYLGAVQHMDGRNQAATMASVSTGVADIRSMVKAQENASPSEVLAAAAERLGALQAQVDEIKRSRLIDDEQREALIKAFAGFIPEENSLLVGYVAGDPEAGDYAKSFMRLFNSIGILATGSKSPFGIPDGDKEHPIPIQANSRSAHGVGLITSDDTLPLQAMDFSSRLSLAGVRLSPPERVGGIDAGKFVFVIGYK